MNIPLIGITTNTLNALEQGVTIGIGAPEQSWQLLAQDYLNMIEKAGGVPVILPVCNDYQNLLPIIEKLDGLILSGGNDINPNLYGEEIQKECGYIDDKRDSFEIGLARYVLEKDLPILGICRGSQVLNVALGGALHQDLMVAGFKSHTILDRKRNEGVHKVEIKKDSILEKIMGEESILVNSFHHQAIKKISPNAEIVAYSDDGVVEAISVPNKKFVLAVQWHPEMMFDDEKQEKIFKAFIEACK